MALDLRDTSFFGHALPEPFVKFQLEGLLQKKGLLPRAAGAEGKALEEGWEALRAKLRLLGEHGGDARVARHVLDPLAERLGYAGVSREEEVSTREGMEDGGWLFSTHPGDARLRAWAVGLGTDLDAPNRRGRAYRFSPSRIAQRVLLAGGERVGLLTDGEELRLLLCDPARPDSHLSIRLDRSGGWRAARKPPDSYRLLIALASPKGVAAVRELTEAARLAQTTVTRKLREQARAAVEGFIQEVLDHPRNAEARAGWTDTADVARALWRESLILVYRLLFVLKLESSADPARAFSFAATSPWRNTYSPNIALAPVVRKVLDQGGETGSMLEAGLRTLFRIFAEGLSASEIEVKALGGMLFGGDAIPLLDQLAWGERAVAKLLDQLLWTSAEGPRDGDVERQRVHYGALDVEDLGRVYEALLELEPGITAEPMCRLRRAKLEVVVPAAQGDSYRAQAAGAGEDPEEEDDGDAAAEEDEEASGRGAKTRVAWVEDIPAGRFFLRVGLGRKASGSYYTPHAFVRFLVQETLVPQVTERSPREDPRPGEILKLKVLDPAMGSGHFLVEACRFLADALYEACRLCDEKALEAERAAERAKSHEERERHLERARELRRRVEDLPDPENELVAYLPSRAAEGEESGLSQKKAEALCRRLVAVHCLYGVDKNELAVALAKVSLWLESYAEGLPLTFLDHRLVHGDSLTGPFFEHLLTYPGTGETIEAIHVQGLSGRLKESLSKALVHVRDLEASIGKDVADLELKKAAKGRLDQALAPFKTLAAAWSGGVMLGDEADDDGYEALLIAVAREVDPAREIAARSKLTRMVEAGRAGVPFDLQFPEIFHPEGAAARVGGFDAVLGNPPWDAIQFKTKEFLAAFDLNVLNAPTKRERNEAEEKLLADSTLASLFERYQESFEQVKRANDRLYEYQKVQIQGDLAGRQIDAFRVFMERNVQLLRLKGIAGVVTPSAFHANAGATGVRRLYLEKTALRCCYSFENKNRLFNIHRSFKFAVVVARRDPAGTDSFNCAFYLHDLDWLFAQQNPLGYTLDFVRKTGGEYLTFLELRSPRDAQVAQKCFSGGKQFNEVCQEYGIVFGRESDMTNDSHRFTPTTEVLPSGEDPRDPAVARWLLEKGYLALHEGKTFHQYDDRWGERSRYLVHLDQLADKPDWRNAARYYRLAFRDIASSTNERTVIFGYLCPSSMAETARCERNPSAGANSAGLFILATSNSYTFDWILRFQVAAHVQQFILFRAPIPVVPRGFLAHSALRLTCNHEGYAALWAEQFGDAWREPKPRHTWPVLDGDDARWGVRAAIDAVVAQAYGLDRGQYEHVLASFSHRSYPRAPDLCLPAFDELLELGLDAFTRKHDPYWDIPLNESLPKPVIDLPGTSVPDPGAVHAGKAGQLEIFASEARESAPRRRRAARASHGPVLAAAEKDGLYDRLALHLDREGVITSRDAQDLTGLAGPRIRSLLDRLIEEGRATREGQGRGTRYQKKPR